jgi:hypothetical protein
VDPRPKIASHEQSWVELVIREREERKRKREEEEAILF